jgi:hypothetical protein
MPAKEIFGPVDEARKVAFDRSGNGALVVLIFGFQQTRL